MSFAHDLGIVVNKNNTKNVRNDDIIHSALSRKSMH